MYDRKKRVLVTNGAHIEMDEPEGSYFKYIKESGILGLTQGK